MEVAAIEIAPATLATALRRKRGGRVMALRPVTALALTDAAVKITQMVAAAITTSPSLSQAMWRSKEATGVPKA